ncbi:MAG: discoidin domain-containing protein [Fimbriimonadaceae bacterium]|nr:discoidin domain-containing protein [Fimbriimonadaceae bacterium]
MSHSSTMQRHALFLLLSAAAVAADPYFGGVGALLPDDATLGRQVVAVPVRQEVWEQPGGPAQVDRAVSASLAAGQRPYLLFHAAPRRTRLTDGREVQTTEPAGLAMPVFANGQDRSGDGDRPNPANQWAMLVHALVERYDGDGLADAPGSPRVAWLAWAAAPDSGATPPFRRDALPGWPGSGFDRLARLVFVTRQAARHADPDVRCGLRLDHPEALRLALQDPAVTLGWQLDFLDVPVPAGVGSDGLLFDPTGLVPTIDRWRDVLDREGGTARLLARTLRLAPGATATTLRAAVPKSQVVAAATRLWAAPWALAAAERPARIAYATWAGVLGDSLASGAATFDEEQPVGAVARCYRFRRAAADLLVAWLYDPAGEPQEPRLVRLPLQRETTYYAYRWDAAAGAAPQRIEGGRDGALVELTVDPVYLLAGDPPLSWPEPGPAAVASTTAALATAAAGNAGLALDGDPATAWWGGAGERQTWWQWSRPDAPLTLEQIRLKAAPLPGGQVQVEASLDGVVWRAVSDPQAVAGYTWQRIALRRRVTAGYWRLLLTKPPAAEAGLYEVELGEPRP